jgi:hypothetical protein
MTILNNGGSWGRGLKYLAIDDKPRDPDPKSIMEYFLKLDEEECFLQLCQETAAGTLTQEVADRILGGYVKKKETYNAYEED